MKRLILFTFIVALGYALFAAATVMARGGHGHGGGFHGGGHYGFGHHGFGGHGIHIGLGFGHHGHYSYGYPYYGFGSYYYPRYYSSYYYPNYTRYYSYPADYGYYADSYYCGQPVRVYRNPSPPVEAAPQPGEPVEGPDVAPAPAPTVVPEESPDQPATQHQQIRANSVAVRRNDAVETVSPPDLALGPRLASPAIRPIAADEEAPWVANGNVLLEHNADSTLATSQSPNDRR